MTILIIEDDAQIRTVLEEAFIAAGRDVQTAESGEAGLDYATNQEFEAIILDVLLPTYSGFEVCQRLREHGVTAPVLMLTCRDREEDIVRGLRLGADDYMTKPFSTTELTALIEALIRRAGGFDDTQKLRAGDLVLDTSRRLVNHKGKVIDLTAREFDLLHFFMRHEGRAVTREKLLAHVWGDEDRHTLNVVDVYVSYLRRKLSRANCGTHLQTVRGFGYIFASSDKSLT